MISAPVSTTATVVPAPRVFAHASGASMSASGVPTVQIVWPCFQALLVAELRVVGRGRDRQVRLRVEDVRVGVERVERLVERRPRAATTSSVSASVSGLVERDVGVGAHGEPLRPVQAGDALDDDRVVGRARRQREGGRER